MPVSRQNIRTTLANWFYYSAGVVFLILAKAKNVLQGYSTPKPFPISEFDKCIEYDIKSVDHWLSVLREYQENNEANPLVGKNILELGPGSDLGVGLYLLFKGAARYNAIDVNNLVESVPEGFYEALFQRLKGMDEKSDTESLSDQLASTLEGKNDRLNYICRDDFDIVSAFGEGKIDIVFSQAAFEHFDDVDSTVRQLSAITKPGSVIAAEIDLKTHSRWIRDKDPNNIYRYGRKFYNLFKFRGIPNRIRPYKYQEIFQRYGWEKVCIRPLATLKKNDFEKVRYFLNKDFHSERNQMEILSVMLCATRSANASSGN